MIQILKPGHHELCSPDRLYPGRLVVDVPRRGLAAVSFRKDGIQSIWLFGRGKYQVRSHSGEVRLVVYGGEVAVEARGHVLSLDATVRGYVAVAVEAYGRSQVEVFDPACSIVAREDSTGTLHRATTGEFFDGSYVRALGNSRAKVHGKYCFQRVIEQSRTAIVTFQQE